MGAFFTSLGINVVSLVWYLVLLGIVYLVVRRYLFKPVLGWIETRQQQINESLDRAEQAQRAFEESRSHAEQVIKEAADRGQEIVRRAERAAADIEEQARQEAKSQAELFLTRARQDIDRERLAALADIRTQVVDLALVAASRLIEQNLDADRNRKLVEEAIQHAELGGGPGLRA